MRIPRRIVAEVSKTWKEGEPPTPGFICQLFEHVIEVNAKRGFALESWQLMSVVDEREVEDLFVDRRLIETIVAVFVDVRSQFTTEGAEEGA